MPQKKKEKKKKNDKARVAFSGAHHRKAGLKFLCSSLRAQLGFAFAAASFQNGYLSLIESQEICNGWNADDWKGGMNRRLNTAWKNCGFCDWKRWQFGQ
jgi:hypothetical protein